MMGHPAIFLISEIYIYFQMRPCEICACEMMGLLVSSIFRFTSGLEYIILYIYVYISFGLIVSKWPLRLLI